MYILCKGLNLTDPKSRKFGLLDRNFDFKMVNFIIF